MNLGKLSFVPVNEAKELVGRTVLEYIQLNKLSDSIWVSEIDPELADTSAFCKHYDIGMGVSANCVILEAKRADKVWYAACLVLATSRADVNGIVRRKLEARRISFAPTDAAVSLTNMEYGGITPIGLPINWPILIDSGITKQQRVIIGSGIRGSKILVSTEVLTSLSNAEVLEITKTAQPS